MRGICVFEYDTVIHRTTFAVVFCDKIYNKINSLLLKHMIENPRVVVRFRLWPPCKSIGFVVVPKFDKNSCRHNQTFSRFPLSILFETCFLLHERAAF